MRRRKITALSRLLRIMARLRSATGCPWDREQTHASLRFHAVEEVYELMDAIESGDDKELQEELGDLLLQVIFHCQLARERGAFDFEKVAGTIAAKLVRRHPHVFGKAKVRDIEGVWTQWEQIKKAEKTGTPHERPSALDGIPKHLPALLRAEKVILKARKGKLLKAAHSLARRSSRRKIATQLFKITLQAQASGWSAEALLRSELQRQEKKWRRLERQRGSTNTSP